MFIRESLQTAIEIGQAVGTAAATNQNPQAVESQAVFHAKKAVKEAFPFGIDAQTQNVARKVARFVATGVIGAGCDLASIALMLGLENDLPEMTKSPQNLIPYTVE